MSINEHKTLQESTFFEKPSKNARHEVGGEKYRSEKFSIMMSLHRAFLTHITCTNRPVYFVLSRETN
jgi:hypothetical protein